MADLGQQHDIWRLMMATWRRCSTGTAGGSRLPARTWAPLRAPARPEAAGRDAAAACGQAADRDQFGAIFEVHGVEMIPAAAPDETFPFERFDHGQRNAVAMRGHGARTPALPSPVVGKARIEIDCGPVTVNAQPVGPGYGPPVVSAGGRPHGGQVIFGQACERPDHSLQDLVDPVTGCDLQRLSKPVYCRQSRFHFATAMPVKRCHQGRRTPAPRIEPCRRRGRSVARAVADRINLFQHILDVRRDQLLA